MKCESLAEKLTPLAMGELPEDQRSACMNHIAGCRSCETAWEGTLAMHSIRDQNVGPTPAHLFEQLMHRAIKGSRSISLGPKFWLGTGFGGAIAASLLAAALALGLLVSPSGDQTRPAVFLVALDEPRLMHIAIEADSPLPGARISILLSGEVRLDGYGDRRELSWNDDLDAGTNKLSLPVVASGENGGQVIVRLSHPDSEQLFVVRLELAT